MAVVLDIIDGSGLEQTLDGFSKTRIAIVSGVSGTTSEKEYQALTTSGVPVMGAALGSTAPLSNVRVSSRTAKPADSNSTSIYHVILNYTTKNTTVVGGTPDNPDLGAFSFDSSLAQVTTTVDRNGDTVTVTYDGNVQGVDYSDMRVEATISASRVESGIQPLDIVDEYLGKVNDRTWQGKAAGFWICSNIRGDSRDGGLTWTVTYQFDLAPTDIIGKDSGGVLQRKTVAWNPVVYYTDPDTGRPPSDLVFNTGFKEVDTRGSANFNVLGF